MAIASPANAVRQRFDRWLAARHGRERGPVVLTSQRVYILPTRFGYLFGTTLLVMFIGAINYSNSMGFALAFLLAGMFANTLWQTHRNLVELQVDHLGSEPVFAGGHAMVSVRLTSPTRRPRHAVGVQYRDQSPVYADVPGGGQSTLRVPVPAPRRGRHALGPLLVYTQFPLGLFHAWSWVSFELDLLVFPRPGPPVPLTRSPIDADGRLSRERDDGEDFSGLRAYRRGDSLKHTAWKAYARGQGLYTKQFAGRGREETWLEWEQVRGEGLETRLSRLCRQVLAADAAGIAYGLRLPDLELPPGSGDAHRLRCLELLATFGQGRGTQAA